MTPGLASLYRPRRTPLHLLPAWFKLVANLGAAIWIVSLRDWRLCAAACAGALVLLMSTLPPARATVRAASTLVLFAAIGAGFHAVFGDPLVGAAIGFNVAAVALLSLAIVASTSSDEILGLVTRLARPFRRWVPPEAMGLAVALMVRSVPEAARIGSESIQAARARGVSRRPTAVLVPTVVRTVGYALRVGDALTARGLVEEPRMER